MSTTAPTPNQRWRPRWGAAFLFRALAFLLPLGAGYFAGAYFAARLAQPRTVSGVVFWWIFVLTVASVAANLVDRYTRRLIPLSGLLKMTMAFPDKAPSRFRVAQRASNITTLRRRIDEAAAQGDYEKASAAELVLSLASALSNHDRKTRGHSERTRAYTDLLSEEMKLPETDRDKLRWAALLHDVGKLDVPAEILNKDGALDEKEWEIVRTHPVAGMRLVAPIAGWLGPWATTIEHHHERWDGTGYPYGLTGEQISLGARIVAVADAYDVMTAGRSYQPSRAHSEARKEVARVSGSQFDPKVVRALMNLALGRLRWSTGPLAAIADFPFLRPLESLGRDLITMVTAGAVTASAAMAGVLPIPDLSIVDADRARRNDNHDHASADFHYRTTAGNHWFHHDDCRNNDFNDGTIDDNHRSRDDHNNRPSDDHDNRPPDDHINRPNAGGQRRLICSHSWAYEDSGVEQRHL